MLFNKTNNGSAELRSLTGNYFANNNYEKVKGDIEFATDELAKIVGYAVVTKAATDYEAGTANELIRYVQMPIAYLATMNMYRKNDVSHEDGGRKVKIAAEGEKSPWEWQIERDDAMLTEMYYKSVDRLIDYLERENIEQWTSSELRLAAQKQFIKSATEFNEYFPIDNSSRIFVMLSPFIREAERMYIKPALGNDYLRLRNGAELSEADIELLTYIRPPIALLAISIAIKRLALSVFPFGVIQRIIAKNHTMSAGDPPTFEMLDKVADWFEDDAEEMIEWAKRVRNGFPEARLVPKNSVDNKYFRV